MKDAPGTIARLGHCQFRQSLVQPGGFRSISLLVYRVLQLVGQNLGEPCLARCSGPRVDVNRRHLVAVRTDTGRVLVASRHVPANSRNPSADDVPTIRFDVIREHRLYSWQHLPLGLFQRPGQCLSLDFDVLAYPPVRAVRNRRQTEAVADHRHVWVVQRPEIPDGSPTCKSSDARSAAPGGSAPFHLICCARSRRSRSGGTGKSAADIAPTGVLTATVGACVWWPSGVTGGAGVAMPTPVAAGAGVGDCVAARVV